MIVRMYHWIGTYGMTVAKPFGAGLWLVALYAFPATFGIVGCWIWLIPTVAATFALLVTSRARREGFG
jgi:hypothetical protein